MANCTITPVSAFQSTNLNSKIDSFNRLSDRVLRSLGYPTVNIEVHRDTLFENISIACEMFAKFAGYTQEYLLFDSQLYDKNHGIRLDHLFSLQNSDALTKANLDNTESPDFTTRVDNTETTSYITLSTIPKTFFTAASSLSAALPQGLSANDIISKTVYDEIIKVAVTEDTHRIGTAIIGSTFEIGATNTTTVGLLSGLFIKRPDDSFTIQGSTSGAPNDFYAGGLHKRDSLINSYDYDLMDYRKVIAVQDFEEGSSTGINTLFTIEQTLAQQTYFSYAMGNYGFDLVSWYVLKEFLEMREKLLATKRSYTFDDRTQIMRLYPQPNSRTNDTRFYGVVPCYVERPIRDIIKEHWVYQYTLALTKISLGNIRGKYGNVTLFGGGTLNSSDFMSQGLAEKEKLETAIYEGAPGLGDAEPPMFFVG